MTLVLICIALYFILKWARKTLAIYAQEKAERNEFDRDYKKRTIRALERMSDSVAPEEEIVESRNALDSFLIGAKKIQEKKQVRDAMKSELKIKW